MPAADNSTVKITIDVVDANSGEVVSRVTKNLAGLGDAGKKAGSGLADGAKQGSSALNDLGNAGASAGRKVGQGLGEAGGHALTALDNVRLLSQTLGLRLPRAMEAAISRNAALMAGISTLGTGLLALGAIEVFAHMAEDAYKVFKNLADVNSEMRKYQSSAAAAATSKLFDTGSLETMNALLQQSQGKIDAIDQKRRSAGVREDGSGSIAQYLGYLYDPNFQAYKKSDDKQAAAASGQRDQAADRMRVLQQQQEIEARTADGSARATALVGAAARQAKEDSDAAIASLKLQQTQLNERHLESQSIQARQALQRAGVHREENLPQIYHADPHAGEAEYNESMRRIREQSGAESTADARKQAEETAHIRAEAQEAGLRGEARYMAERDEHLRQLKERLRDTELSPLSYMQQVAAAERQYSAERQKRLDNERAETKRIQDEASAGGVTGLARTDAEHASRLDAIAKQAPDFSDAATAGQRKSAENGRYQQQQQQQADQFTDRLKQLDEGRADSTMSTNQRIDAENRRAQAEILKAWQELYGNLDQLDARRVTSYAALQGEMSRMDAEAARQKAQARQQLEDQTLKVEAEGGRRGMTREQEERQAILDAYSERYRQLEELRQKDSDNADLYRRQEIAAEQEKNGKLLEQERQMRDQLAGQLRGFMDNPLQALRKLGEDAASKYAADMLLKASGKGSGTVGASGGRGSALGDLVGMPEWHRNGGATHAGTGTAADPAKVPPVVTGSSTVSAASTELRAGSATIYVTQATFPGLGGAAGSGASPAAAMAAAGVSGGAAPAFAVGNAGTSGSSSTNDGTGYGIVNATPAAGASISAMRGGDAGIGGSSSTNGGSGYGILSAPSGSYNADGTISTSSFKGYTGGGSTGQTGLGEARTAVTDLSGGISQAQGAAQLGQQLFKGMGNGSTSAALGKASSALGTAAGYAGAGAGLFTAAAGNGGFGGALQGLSSGAQLGGMIGGPLGAGIGAAAGAVLGFIGLGGAHAANVYYDKTVKPRITNDITQFGMGSMDYSSAYQDLVSLDKEARDATKKFGMGGKSEWDNRIHPDIINAQHQLTSEQKAGRNQYTMGAAEFHGGGLVNGFGDMSTGPDTGWAHLQRGETVMHQSATSMHGDALSLMLAGASRGDMAGYYGGTTQPESSGAEQHIHIHAIDTQSAVGFLQNNKHQVRAAVNSSYAENSGGSDFA